MTHEEFELDDRDQLWYCGDTHHWVSPNHVAKLTQLLQQCSQAKYHVALSNPCFEIWLLLHFADVSRAVTSSIEICEKLSAIAGGYSKFKRCKQQFTSEMVNEAINRAMLHDQGTDDIPKTPTTRIYRVLGLLIQRESIFIN